MRGWFRVPYAGNRSRGNLRARSVGQPKPTGLPSFSGLGLRPFKAATRVRIPLGVRFTSKTSSMQGPVAQLVSASPCHGEGRGFESRQGRKIVQLLAGVRGQVAQLVRASA